MYFFEVTTDMKNYILYMHMPEIYWETLAYIYICNIYDEIKEYYILTYRSSKKKCNPKIIAVIKRKKLHSADHVAKFTF